MASLAGTRREGAGWQWTQQRQRLFPASFRVGVDGMMTLALPGVFFKTWATMAAQRMEAAMLEVLIPRWQAMVASEAVCDDGIMISLVSVFLLLDIG